ncbi:MAG: hypothetical protein HC880_12590 [Bacteroidia bacterium]|nr:hypothetical protein [Bacteroidia bacterium]
MKHIAHVEQLDQKRSLWQAFLPQKSGRISWEAEIVEDIENEIIAWRALPNASSVENYGEVRFKDALGGNGTEMQVKMYYVAYGPLRKAIYQFVSPMLSHRIRTDLRRFKEMMEENLPKTTPVTSTTTTTGTTTTRTTTQTPSETLEDRNLF